MRKLLSGFMMIVLSFLIPAVVSANPEGTVVAAINCGGPEYTDASGITYQADNSFTGGSVYSTPAFIAGTDDQTLYQNERWGEFSYSVEVPNQSWYLVTLKFAEIYPYALPGSRRFSVVMEGQKVVYDLDLFSWAGGTNKAFDAKVPVLVLDGILNIDFFGEQFCPPGRTAQAKVNAILVEEIVTPFNYSPAGTAAAINAGGQDYTDYLGITYQADHYYHGGNTSSTTQNIFQTDEDPLYQTERYGDFSYNIPVANATYRVVLRFAEIYPYIQNGSRQIAVDIEGKRVISHFDLYTKFGLYRPYDFIVPFPIAVNDGVLNIDFYSEECCPAPVGAFNAPDSGVCRKGNAKISAILVSKDKKPVLE